MIDALGSGYSNNQANPYGNIQRVGSTSNGRCLYRVINSQGEDAGRLSIPNRDIDIFEAAYKDIMDSAPKIQKYVSEHSSPEDIKKRKIQSRYIVITGGVIGAAIPVVITKNSSVTKKVLATVAGIITGLSAGFAASVAATTPPGTYKFAKATRTFSKLDIRSEK